MKTIKYFIIFLFVNFYITSNVIPKEIFWIKLDSSWDLYLKHPSKNNANSLISLLPDSAITKQGDLKVKEKLWSDLDFLEQKIMTKDTNALKITFKLIAISDGGFAEELCIILGNSITLMPGEFLQSLKSNIKLAEPVLSTILTHYDFTKFKNNTQEKREALARISALKKVNDIELRKIRSRCIKILKRNLEKL